MAQVPSYLYVLPWLRLHQPEAFAAVEVAPAESCLQPDDSRTPGARKVLGCYKGLDGRPVTPVLMWLADRGPLDLDQQDHASLERHRMALAAALIIGSHYYVGRRTGLGATTAAHSEGFLHSFETSGAHTAIYKRCREGWYADGWPLDRLSITVPLPASPQQQLPFDRSLCEAIIETVGSGAELGEKLEFALPPFLQGNSLSSSTTLLDDMVWMGAAFERLLEAATPIGLNLSTGIRDLFAGVTENQTTWTPVNVQGNPTTPE